MNRQEICEAFQKTLDNILEIYEQLNRTTDPREKDRLMGMKKELMHLQIKYIDLLVGTVSMTGCNNNIIKAVK